MAVDGKAYLGAPFSLANPFRYGAPFVNPGGRTAGPTDVAQKFGLSEL